jgi:type VI protein secretion system component VasK
MTSALLPAISLAVAVELAIFPTWYSYHPMERAARFILLWGVLWLAGMASCALRPRTVLLGALALLFFAPLLTMSDWIVSRTDVDRVAAIGFLLLLVAIAYTPMLFMWTHQRWFGDSEARKPSP